MSEQTAGSTHPPAHNQRRGEEHAPGTDAPEPADSPDTPPVPDVGAYRSGAPSGEVAPT